MLNQFIKGHSLLRKKKTLFLSDEDLARAINQVKPKVAVFLLENEVITPTESPPNAIAVVYCVNPMLLKFAETLIHSTAITNIDWEEDEDDDEDDDEALRIATELSLLEFGMGSSGEESEEEEDNPYNDPDIYLERMLLGEEEGNWTESMKDVAQNLEYDDDFSLQYEAFAYLEVESDDQEASRKGIFEALGKKYAMPDYDQDLEYTQETAEESWLPAVNDILEVVFQNGEVFQEWGIGPPEDNDEDPKETFIEAAMSELVEKAALPLSLQEDVGLLQDLIGNFYDTIGKDSPKGYLKILQEMSQFQQLCQCKKDQEEIKKEVKERLSDISEVYIPIGIKPGQIETTLNSYFVRGMEQSMPYGKVVRVTSIGDGSCYFWSCAQGYYQFNNDNVPVQMLETSKWSVDPDQAKLSDSALSLRIGDAEWNDPNLGAGLNIPPGGMSGPTVQTYWWFALKSIWSANKLRGHGNRSGSH